MSKELNGKVAVVTGAAKGIGAGIARAFADAGANVVVNYARDREAATGVVAAIRAGGGRAIAVQADVSRPEDIVRLFSDAAAEFGSVDILVNNAGVFHFAPLVQADHQHISSMLETNVMGTIMACRAALPYFPEEGGAVINIGSMSSRMYSPGAVAYTASKAAITGVTGVLAVELAPRGIRVNQIDPGAVDTEGARALGAMSDASKAVFAERTPLGRVGLPDDIASVAVFLASDAARWVTGESLAVSGGLR